MTVPTGISTRLIASAFFVCLLTGSAWANGIRHPSDYGVSPLTSCGTQTAGPVTILCFDGGGGFTNDLLINFALVSPSPSTSITSVTFDFPVAPTGFGLLEGKTSAPPDPCSGDNINVPCSPDTSLVTIADSTNGKFTFTNFTGDLSGEVTAFFSFNEIPTAFKLTDATVSTTATPEPSELGLLTVALASLIMVRRRQQAKQNS